MHDISTRDHTYYKILHFWSPLILWRCGLPKGAKVVATNGCFDILHAGHIKMLEYAKSLGDYLVVGLNADVSIRTLKGPTRPINHQDNRKKVLEALRCVDFVHIFYEERSWMFLSVARPNVFVKSGDYTLENMDQTERKLLEAMKTKIDFSLNMVDGLSTSKTIQALQI